MKKSHWFIEDVFSFEVDIIRTILRREGLSIVDINDPQATIEGGDVLFTGREFFVGLSKTTNLAGAKAVASAFPEYPVTLLRVSIDILH